ncbi:MAG: biopolymer transporter ExbD [Flavobacterium sp.]|uniref:ExbD/TolR family protein n=1 Tax=Flavobacterium sp. TaxID=239 RepID=UPI0012197D5F|nr:biopolymer transporter ExbD [Flavobacterium sp.]RZJ65186.1 MAG: biopolymer transporter ExbD [Flavobacterium sp.]
MAELNTESNAGDKAKKVRSRKLNSKVDLTAMVDLAFLLITFFMLTTSLAKPQAMDLTIPSEGEPNPVDENRTLTILIGKDDKLKCFMGKSSEHTPKELAPGKELRNEIASRKKDVLAYSTAKGTPEKGLIVLIKPGKNSNYGNLVDVLDEMAISEVPTYAITDLLPEETKLLK